MNQPITEIMSSQTILTVKKKQEISNSEKNASEEPQSPPAIKQEETPRIFQAVGIIEGEVSFDEKGAGKIALGGQVYNLRYLPWKKQKFLELQQQVEETGNARQRLVVYPQVTHFPDRESQHLLYFVFVGFSTKQNKNNGILGKVGNLEFTIGGLWQFIPVCRFPVVSVFKNLTPERLEWIKQAEAKQRVKFMKPAHLPVLWKEAPVRPFKYNPRAEEQEKPAFVKIKAKFLPKKNAFVFESLLDSPTTENVPKFLKASKRDKQLVQQEKQEKPDSDHATQPTKEETTLSIEEKINRIANQLENRQEIATQNQKQLAETLTHQLITHRLKDETYSLPKNYLSNWKHGRNVPKETSKHYYAFLLWQLLKA
jgi:hypothetical protein